KIQQIVPALEQGALISRLPCLLPGIPRAPKRNACALARSIEDVQQEDREDHRDRPENPCARLRDHHGREESGNQDEGNLVLEEEWVSRRLQTLQCSLRLRRSCEEHRDI